MARHLTPQELEFVTDLKATGKGPLESHAALESKRKKRGIRAPAQASSSEYEKALGRACECADSRGMGRSGRSGPIRTPIRRPIRCKQ